MMSVSADLLEATIAHLYDLLSRLEADRAALDAHIRGVRDDLERLENETVALGSEGANGVQKRRRKGQNARSIAELFDAESGGAWTKQEIADKTGLPFSSVQAILAKADCDYVQGPDGLWRKKDGTGEQAARTARTIK